MNNKKKKLIKNINSLGVLISKIQKKNGDIPWYHESKTDPWDHIESAMGLSISGFLKESKKAFKWLKYLQKKEGSWYTSYKNNIPNNKTKETNFSSYIAVGVFQYWLISSDLKFLKSMWNTIYNGINFTLKHQRINGDIYWAISPNGIIDKKSLLTSSSSIFLSLKCAIAIGHELGIKTQNWKIALKKLKNSILFKSKLFDNLKKRFSMDWYYPILCGVISGGKAYKRIKKYWNIFVVENLGIKCVSNHPWITIAETSELILSLNAINKNNLAKIILNWIIKDRFKDGTYWCGFTFPKIKIWPNQKITWNNAAILIAIDSLYNLTPASNMFNHKWWKKKYNIY